MQGYVSLSEVKLDGGDLYWEELRPFEQGRLVVVRRRADGTVEDVTPAGFNARTKVHEYGGGAYCVDAGTVWFSNFSDQRVYRQDPSSDPRAITPAGDLRYADGVVDRRRQRIVCVREDHTRGMPEAVNEIVAVDVEGRGEPVVLAGGYDFYAFPRLSPDGDRLCWTAWRHPNMPWDGTELWAAEVGADGLLSGAQLVAGGPRESIFQPEWSPGGALHFVSDRSGWWNHYRYVDGQVEPLLAMDAEFAGPQWQLGFSLYSFISADEILVVYASSGRYHLARFHVHERRLEELDLGYTEYDYVRTDGRQAAFCAASPTEPASIVALDLESGRRQVIRRSFDLSVDRSYLSVPDEIEFPTEQGLTAHAIYYAPANSDYKPPAGESPPLIVHCHGGPTSDVSSGLRLQNNYWTSRGFALLDVNYGGSSGYGRAYRERLNGQWGVVDVDDCVNAARYLIEKGLADPARVAISGGSAGGYTTLACLTTRDLFRAGADHFGLSDLVPFVKDTHKFESRYLESLIGPYPERADLYRERSPVTHVDRLSCPVIIFQGLEDEVVPPSQSEIIVEALKRKGLAYAYVTFEGEQHGFRRAKNIKRSLDGELFFYSQVFDFGLAEEVEAVEIENL